MEMSNLAQALILGPDGQVDPMKRMVGQSLFKQGVQGMQNKNPNALTGLNSGLQTGMGLLSMMPASAGPQPIAPAAAMNAYNAMPASYTMPGMG